MEIGSTARVEQSGNIFHKQPTRALLFREVVDEPRELVEETTSFAEETFALPLVRKREVLTWESAAPKFTLRDFFCFDIVDVSVKFSVWPMIFELPLAEFVDFALEKYLHAGPFKADVNAANATEKR